MFKDNYVVVLKANGNIIEEDASKRMFLPFGQEYSVRIINKNSHNCAAELEINGEKIGRFYVKSGETTDIERYLDNNNYSGKRFKFTNLNDAAVKDKTDIDNGFIQVSFFKERPRPEPIIIKEYHHYNDPWPVIHPQKPWPNTPWYVGDVVCDNYHLNKSYGGMSTSFGSSTPIACNASFTASNSGPIEGATVRGSESKQSFSNVYGKDFESESTIIRLKLFNGEIETKAKYCSGCGRKNSYGHKFCPSCGKGI